MLLCIIMVPVYMYIVLGVYPAISETSSCHRLDIFLAPEVLSIFIAGNILNLILLFFRENKAWHFMRIICLADGSHEMPCLVFVE